MPEIYTLQNTTKFVHQRFINLLIGFNFAREQLGFIDQQEYEDSEQANSRRKLLAIEQHALKTKKRETSSQNNQLDETNNILHKEIRIALEDRINNLDEIYTKFINFPDNIPACLDILAVKAASVGRIDPLISDLSWLSDDLLHLINMPQYRPKDKKSIQVKDVRLALRYIGLENLKFVIPAFSMRRFMPFSTEPFTLLKRKLWDYTLASANCARVLAEQQGLDPYVAFTATSYSSFSYIIITRLYLRLFSEIWESELKQARENKLKDYHDAMIQLEPDGVELRKLIIIYGDKLCTKFVDKMQLKRLMIKPIIEELQQPFHEQEYSPLATVVAQAQAYAKYYLLNNSNLIEVDEAKNLFTYFKVNNQQIRKLKTINKKSLNLKME